MPWFGKKTNYSWKPQWTYDVPGMFWRLKISEEGLILCEVRNPEKKTTWFNCIDERTGVPLWENKTFDEPWWIGIEDIQNNRAYIHRFRKPDMPQHIGIAALDLPTGEILWNNPDVTFHIAADEGVYGSVQGFENRRFYLLNHSDGSVMKELRDSDEEIHAIRAGQNEEYLFRDYRYPTTYMPQNNEPYPYDELLAPHIDLNRLRGTLDIFSSDGIVLASWHETGKEHTDIHPYLNQPFIAVEIASKSLIYKDDVNTGVRAPGMDSFFIKANTVYYIKDQHILTALQLPSE